LRSVKNMDRIAKSDPNTALETDKFLGILRELEGDDEATKAFILVCYHLGRRLGGKESH
jgi:hypothetical protein